MRLLLLNLILLVMVYYICIFYKSITIFSGATPVVCAKDAAGVKYRMAEEFSVDTFRQFMVDLAAGDIEPYLKSGTNIFFFWPSKQSGNLAIKSPKPSIDLTQ